ncbi:collagen alpha-1(VIII) chain-like [Spodoptera litura]|uniref:Collagen alpha-1(VIII) chain-like n=1 Tax=Spodoptera litura TaxID=69820 RepID=A0A9J7EG94_SPOLT|nr:collagen alpha-1(VIII) chain-like [Spodoptera litura]
MDIGERNDRIRYQVLVILAVLVTSLPPSTGYIDCRISCRRCHENTEHPSVLEVYCAMCEECKQRRRERMKGRTTSARTTLIRMRDGVRGSAEALAKSLLLGQQAAAHPPERPGPSGQPGPLGSPSQYLQPGQLGHHVQPRAPGHPGQGLLPMFMQQHPQSHPQLPQHEPGTVSRPAQRGYGNEMERPMPHPSFPTGCPTPPVCPESEEEPEIMVEVATTTTSTTTQATTTPHCPPIKWCRKKRKHQPSCMPCMPMCPCPVPQPMTMTAAPTHLDYQYLYIGLPKNILRSS